MPRQSANTKRFKAVVRFLLGEAPLDGRWFGDEPPKTKTGRPPPYWWRTELRSATEKMLFDLCGARENAQPLARIGPPCGNR
jgi:hypothetical protein